MNIYNNFRLLSNKPFKGLTLIELMVVVAVLGVLLSMAIPSLADLMERRRITAVAFEVASVLTTARSEANLSYEYITVHLEKDPSNKISCISFNQQHGSDGLCKCYNPVSNMCPGITIPMLRTFQINNIDGVSFDASADHWGSVAERIAFRRNSFFTGFSGVKILVTGKRTNGQLRVELNDANRIRTCSPNGSIGGFPVC